MARFQSALPRGERRKYGKSIKVTVKFQSALPRGERHMDAIKKERDE